MVEYGFGIKVELFVLFNYNVKADRQSFFRGYEACQNRISWGYKAYQNCINRGYEAYQNRITRGTGSACSSFQF